MLHMWEGMEEVEEQLRSSEEVEKEEEEGDVVEPPAPEETDKKAEEWVEDPDSDIMDAKVMRKGDKKLIIVDMPDPRARWRKPP